MKEIEVKARVQNPADLVQAIEKLGIKFLDPITQDDSVFVNYEGDFTKYPAGANFLRIRNQNGRNIFTLKQPLKNDLDCIEKETEITNPKEMREAIELMGYHEAAHVYKVRRKAHYNDYEICLDEVKDLGTFIEVEKMSNEDNSEKVQEELFAFLEALGVKREDRVTQGYDILIWLKNRQ